MNRFTVRDIPMISNSVRLNRWPGVTDEVKQDAVEVLSEALLDDETPQKLKLQAVAILARLESQNMKQEHFLTPKVDMSLEQLTDEELEQQLAKLEAMEKGGLLNGQTLNGSQGQIASGETA